MKGTKRKFGKRTLEEIAYFSTKEGAQELKAFMKSTFAGYIKQGIKPFVRIVKRKGNFLFAYQVYSNGFFNLNMIASEKIRAKVKEIEEHDKTYNKNFEERKALINSILGRKD